MWRTDLLCSAFARAFAPLPSIPLWQWADENVWIENRTAAEAGPYRSSKTPWNRRIQELIQKPRMHCYDFSAGQWIEARVTEINVMKCSQGGVSEACLNGIRYKATFQPCNVIYSLDTRETAKDMCERLEPSLRRLDENIFTGDDDDIGTLTMRLRAMDIWFQGSFSSGKFVGKQAPFVIADEVEEHATESKDASSISRLKSRKKCADNGLQINLCKPKLEKGPIHRAWLRGNCEEFMISCPHCKALQPLTFFRNEDDAHPRVTPFSDTYDEIRDEQNGKVLATLPRPLPLGEMRTLKTGRLVFDHCKNLLGQWDKLRILRETYYECGYCLGKIEEHNKRDLVANAVWIPTAIGTPGIVSKHISDLYSSDANSAWGQIVLDYLQAKAEGRRELQGWYNDRLGLYWREQVFRTRHEDIIANIAGRDSCPYPAYARGQVPFFTDEKNQRAILLLGADVMLNFSRWSVGVLAPNLQDIAIVDWGEEMDPHAIAGMMQRVTWPVLGSERRARVAYGFIDSHWRPTDTYKACLSVPNRILIPTTGIGGVSARSVRTWAWNHIPTYPSWFHKLTYNDREALDEVYLNRIKHRKRRLLFPADVEQYTDFLDELCAEEIEEDENGTPRWKENPPENHWGDTVKEIVVGSQYLNRKNQPAG